jgi:glyoxylase-like metal-dependent hydrolase (beta-lactamase superfamily II)
VKRILLTHLHKDHTGGLKRLIELTRARTFAHWIEAAFIAGNPVYDGPGMPPADHVTVDEVLKDGDALDSAGGLTVFHTPGHTPGHSAYYQSERKVLFSGDLFFGDGERLILTTPEYTQHLLTAKISARRVGQLAVDAVLPYHGGPFATGGGKLLRHLLEGL